DKARLHARLARLPADPTQVAHLQEHLLRAAPDEVSVLKDSLEPHKAELIPKLWPVVESARPGDPGLLPAAGALAAYDPGNPRWPEVGPRLAQAMVGVGPELLETWLRLLTPVRGHLKRPLAVIFGASDRPEAERDLATRCLVQYAAEDPGLL